MTGDHDSVIGVQKELALERFLTKRPIKFEVAEGKELIYNAVLIDIDSETGKANSIIRISERG